MLLGIMVGVMERTFCKVLNCKKIQYVQELHILLLTASMFHFGTNYDSSFKELSLNLVKTHKNGGGHVENR